MMEIKNKMNKNTGADPGWGGGGGSGRTAPKIGKNMIFLA